MSFFGFGVGVEIGVGVGFTAAGDGAATVGAGVGLATVGDGAMTVGAGFALESARISAGRNVKNETRNKITGKAPLAPKVLNL